MWWRKKHDDAFMGFIFLGLLAIFPACGSFSGVTRVEIQGNAENGGQWVLDFGNGTEGIPMKSIIDTAAVSCAFSLPSGTSTNGEVVLVGNATCANAASNNQNNCIECNTSASGNTCSVSCSGWIPSRADVAADSMTIRLVLTSTLTTDMPDVTVGGIQFVGDTSLWTAFDPQVTLATDTAGCNGNPSTTEMTLGTLHASSSTAADGWNHRYPISAGGSQSNHCTVGHQIDGIISFSGADTGGTTISSAGTVTMIAKICDLAASCGM